MLILLHSTDDAPRVRDEILTHFEQTPIKPVALDLSDLPDLEAGSTVVAYLSDENLALLLPKCAERDWRVGLLPHHEMRNARLGFGISEDLGEAVEDILTSQDEHAVDLLYCNKKVVLNSVIIGDPLATPQSAGTGASLAQRAARVVSVLRFLSHTPPMRFKLETAKGKQVETAAMGVVVVEHGRSDALSRRLLKDSAANDGMLHCLIYAPRSILMMLWFMLSSMIIRPPRRDRPLPSFVGHIKTEALKIRSQRPVRVSIDGVVSQTEEIEMSVDRGTLLLIPGRHLHVEHAEQNPKEVFRTSGIPTDELLEALKDRHLPWINRATPEEFRELFQVLRGNAKLTESYVVLMVLSSALATFGLFANSSPVIIGAMILAPLMSPIVAMSMGVLRTNEPELLRSSARSFLIGVLVAVGCTAVITLLTPLRTINSEIAARLNPTLLDMGVAVVSGMAGAYAHARAEVAKSLAGVAIAVALVPPLAVVGIGVGRADAAIFFGAGLLFVTNFVGMILAGAATFLVLGYSPFKYSRSGVTISVVSVLAVSVMLTPSFLRMVDEHRIIAALDGWEAEADVTVDDVGISHGTPTRISVRLLSNEPIDVEKIDRIKKKIEERIGREILLEARVGLMR